MLKRSVSRLPGMGSVNLLYNNAKEANFRRSVDIHKSPANSLVEIPKIEEDIAFDRMKEANPDSYMYELSKIVLIPSDFDDIKNILFDKDLIVVTAHNAHTAVLYSNFFRGIKRDSFQYKKFVFARPSGIKITPCYETLNCTVKDCDVRHLDAARVCFRLNELGICGGNCSECKFMDMRYTQIISDIETTREIMPTIDQRKGMCGKNMCREGKLRGCPDGCNNN